MDHERFRAVQRLAYDGAEAVAATLEPGDTEKDAAARLKTWLVDRGVDDWFHLPFAWFGDRTAFRRFRTPLQFFPTNRRLTPGMPYILDVAPVVAGATADIGFTSSLGPNPVVDQMLDDLAAHRTLILDGVLAGHTLAAVYAEVDALAAEQGYDNRHQEYPGRVLAHQVPTLPERRGRGVVAGFGLRHLGSTVRSLRVGRSEGWSPLWNGSRRSDHPATPGLWAVEPHLGLRDVGAKFEELLVVTDDGDAHWLDDDLPHVRRTTATAGVRA